MMNYIFFATARSGHHAVLDWVIDMCPWPMEHYNNPNWKYFREGQIVTRNPAVTYNAYKRKATGLVYNFENRKLGELNDIIFSEVMPPEREIIVVIRDYYNMMASSIKSSPNRFPEHGQFRQRTETWLNHAENMRIRVEAEVDDPYVVFIRFNKWADSRDYRMLISEMLGLRYSENTLDKLPSAGGGSSFDSSKKYHNRASEMDVNNRYHDYIEHPVMQYYLEKYPEIRELNKILFDISLP